MKKTVLTVVFAFISLVSFSQKKGTNEFLIAVGGLTSNDILHVLEDDLFDGAIRGVSYKNQNTGVVTLTYKKAIKDNMFLYVEGSYQKTEDEMLQKKKKIGDVNLKYYTVALGAQYNYLNRSIFQLYSGVTVGYTFRNSDYTIIDKSQQYDDINDNYLNFQVNAIGFRVGKALAANLELGFGYKGIVSLGVSYQF